MKNKISGSLLKKSQNVNNKLSVTKKIKSKIKVNNIHFKQINLKKQVNKMTNNQSYLQKKIKARSLFLGFLQKRSVKVSNTIKKHPKLSSKQRASLRDKRYNTSVKKSTANIKIKNNTTKSNHVKQFYRHNLIN